MPLRIGRKHNTQTNMRLAKILTGKRGLFASPDLDVDVSALNGSSEASTAVSVEEASAVVVPEFVSDDRPFMENEDEWKNPYVKRGVKKWIRRYRRLRDYIRLVIKAWNDKEIPFAARLQLLWLGREYTFTERLEIIETDERRRLEMFHRDAAKRIGILLIETLANLGMCDWYQLEKHGRKITKKIRFDWVEHSPLVYRYHVDARRLPWKINIFDLYQQPVVTTLSGSATHPVRARNEIVGDQVTGLIYEVEIAATLGVPNKCFFSEVLPRVPDSAPALAFITGYTENKRINWASLEDMPHLLGGGQTMGGKSNMTHVMLCTFIARNKPDDVRLALVDLKFDGIELSRYKGIPHLISGEIDTVPDGIAANPKEAIKVLEWADKEAQRRGRMFKAEGVQNLKLWNRRHKSRHLAEIVIMIDELSLLRMDGEHGADAYKLMQVISSTARASGIHLVAFTQSSNRRVVDEMIKINFPGRICFSVPDSSSSILFVNDGSAINLMPAGRAVFKHGTSRYTTQTPLIEPGEIDQIVKNAKAGKTTQKLDAVHLTPEEIIEWAIEDNNSSLARADTLNKFKDRIIQGDLEKMLKNMEGETHFVGDRAYQVLPGIGNRPRIVVRVDNKVAPDSENLHATPHATAENGNEPVTRDEETVTESESK